MGFRSIDHKNISNIAHIGEARYKSTSPQEESEINDCQEQSNALENEEKGVTEHLNTQIERKIKHTYTNYLSYELDIGVHKTT